VETVRRGRYRFAPKGGAAPKPRYRSKDNGALMGLPSYVKSYFITRAAVRSSAFAAYC